MHETVGAGGGSHSCAGERGGGGVMGGELDGELGELVAEADGAGHPGALDNYNPLALAFAPSSDREHSAVDSEEGE